MYALKAKFRPTKEPKGGYIGKADLTVAKAVQINNISVFKNEQDGSYSIQSAKFGKNNERSFFIPSSKEAYAAAVAVIGKAVEAEKHFAVEKGDYGVKLEISGSKVDEKYADGRYSVSIGDFCTLNGISTKEVSYDKDGETKEYVAVDLPPVRDSEGHVKTFTDQEGNQHVNLQFEFLKDKYTNKEGKEVSTDYKTLFNNMVRKCRKEFDKALDNQIGAADSKKEQQGKDNFVPKKEEQER